MKGPEFITTATREAHDVDVGDCAAASHFTNIGLELRTVGVLIKLHDERLGSNLIFLEQQILDELGVGAVRL